MTNDHLQDRPAQKETNAAAFLARLAAAPAIAALDGTRPLDRQALAELTRERIRLGARWLAGIVQPDGAFPYIYHPETDTYDSARYNEVRHAGTVLSLFQAGHLLNDAGLLAAAEAATPWITNSCLPTPFGGRAYVYQGRSKLGGQALALIALLERRKASGNRSFDPLIDELAAFLHAMELPDEPGRYYQSYDVANEARLLTPDSDYYPGEALLALTRLAEQFPDGPHLAAAQRAARYLIHQRDGDIIEAGRIPRQDHWLAIALGALYRLDPNPEYATVAWLQGESMIASQIPAGNAEPWQLGGARHSANINFTSTASRTEALVAAWDLAAHRQDTAATGRFSEAALRSIQFLMRVQYTAETSRRFPNPGRAIGGWGQDITNPRIRIDFVQHNISALIGACHLLSGTNPPRPGTMPPQLIRSPNEKTMPQLTIGMPTYKDYDGVYFTLQSLRLYHDLEDTELLVVDNFGDEHTEKLVKGAGGRYIKATDAVGSAAAKNVVFQEAKGDAVLCCDSHVFFPPGVIARLKQYHQDHPDSIDLLQGPLVYDDLQNISTHFDPVWRGQMWGIWANDPRGNDPEAEPFDIPMQGMGAFSCRKDAWVGFNPAFRGFGGEEGYIHEKFRQAGARTLCLPWFRWTHRFGRPGGVPYPLFLRDKLRNYFIGFTELGLDLTPVIEHFSEHTTPEMMDSIMEEALVVGVSWAGASGEYAQESAVDPPATPRAPAPMSSKALRKQERARTNRRLSSNGGSASGGRAIVTFVDQHQHIIQQFLALRESWLYSQTPDTDLVAFGPASALDQLPDDVVKIPQQPATDDPVWQDYRFINAIACVNGPGAEQLDGYSHILRTDADTFITPAWNSFSPNSFTCGHGAYAHSEEVRQHILRVAGEHGLTHRDITNIGHSWYGPTQLVRETAALAETLTKHLLTREFAETDGAWPGWFRGVAVRYASEIAINHLAPDAQKSDLLDAPSTSEGSTENYPHIHCPHTDSKFSKHWFMSGRYTPEDAQGLDLTVVRDYAVAMSFQSIGQAVSSRPSEQPAAQPGAAAPARQQSCRA